MLDTSLLSLWSLIIPGGFVVGFLVGMTGVGAGSLMTPFLIAHVGVQPALAVGTDLLFASITKASAAAPHHNFGNVNWRIVRWLAAGSVPGSVAMLALIEWLEPDLATMAHVIKSALVVALILSSAAILVYPMMLKRKAISSVEAGSDQPVRPLPTLLLGLLLGSIVTLTSVGAGAIGVVVLTLLYPALRTRHLIGTDIVHAVPLTLVSGLGHLSMGNTNFTLLGLLLVGSLPGIAIGSRLTGRLPDKLLRAALAAILVFAAYQLWLKS
ncbi:sulfite exporter TauE/SafE family protein [uncultured Hyphomicrobium sp.]|uniref:sulfite exporter TauE/SafE family protein n=1 Tax=uncultured Hyphomicrobium sp. TaxID=194373 RepID=UPI0025E77637|nr:sulfite exporter TauE/SafE family protein [uncultured Hyphomicrobium sp.]